MRSVLATTHAAINLPPRPICGDQTYYQRRSSCNLPLSLVAEGTWRRSCLSLGVSLLLAQKYQYIFLAKLLEIRPRLV